MGGVLKRIRWRGAGMRAQCERGLGAHDAAEAAQEVIPRRVGLSRQGLTTKGPGLTAHGDAVADAEISGAAQLDRAGAASG